MSPEVDVVVEDWTVLSVDVTGSRREVKHWTVLSAAVTGSRRVVLDSRCHTDDV